MASPEKDSNFQEKKPRQEKTLLGLYKTAMKAYGPQ